MACTRRQAKRVRTLKRRLLVSIKDGLLKKHKIIISPYILTDPSFYAEVDRPEGLLVLNPSIKKGGLNEFLASFIHECLHVLLGTGDERAIRRLEKHIWKDMSNGEKDFVLSFVAKNATWD